MNLGNWLRSLGLERHEAAFRDNAIDEAVLRDLKEDHLRELGLPLGARIKLLKAIAALPQEIEIQFPAGIAVAGSPADSAERRQVTVMLAIWLDRRRCRRSWIRRISASSSRPIRSA